MKVSIILPIYNEAENIVPLLEEITGVMNAEKFDYEIVAVDDGSKDKSLNVLKTVRESLPQLKIISFRKNVGQSAAFDAGFRNISGDIVVTMDSDRQNDPKDIPRLIQRLNEGFDLVTGWRKDRKDGFVLRKFPSLLANWLIRKLTKTKIHDLGCSLKVYRREVTDEMRLYGEMHRFICPMAESLGANVTELPVNHRARVAGVSKYGLSRTLKVVLDLGHLLFIRNFQTKPIYFFGGIGAICIALGGCATLVTAFEKFSQGIFVHRNPLFLIAIFLVLLGFQFMGTGLIAEVLMRTYFESQNKTAFTIREQIGFQTGPKS